MFFLSFEMNKMNKQMFLFFSIMSLFFIGSCQSDDDCIIPEIEWMEISSNEGSNDDMQFRAEVIAALEAELNKIQNIDELDGNLLKEIGASWSRTINNNANKKVAVTQEFYQNYIKRRVSLCTLLDVLKNNQIKDIDNIKRCESLFIELISELHSKDGNATDSKKKTQNNINLTHRLDSIKIVISQIKSTTQIEDLDSAKLDFLVDVYEGQVKSYLNDSETQEIPRQINETYNELNSLLKEIQK